jgi:hypothetical protein
MTAATANEREAATLTLDGILEPGDRVTTVLRHVSRSGMSRSITLMIGDENGDPWDISPYVARAGVGTFDRNHGGVKIGGAGMDMGFALVYNLGRTLYPDGFECIGDGCPSNDHSNGDRDYTPHHHRDGGYALRQVWL